MKQQHTFHHLSNHLWESPRGLCMFMAIPPHFPIISGPHRPRPHRGPTGAPPGLSLFVADLPRHLPLQHEELLDEFQALELRLQRSREKSITSPDGTGARAWNCLFQVIFLV